MSDLYAKNLTRYVLYGVGAVLVGVLTALAQQLPGTEPIAWREVASAGVSALLSVLTMALASTTLTRLGSEQIARQVNGLREQGVHRDQMIVLAETEAAEALAQDPVAMIATMSADDLVRVRDAAMARHQTLISQPPHWLDTKPREGG